MPLQKMSVHDDDSLSLRDDLNVIDMDPSADPRWEAFVANHPHGLVYHHPAYLECLRREYGQPAMNLACEEADGRLCGVLPLLYTRRFPVILGSHGPRKLSSLPRTPMAGPLVHHDRAREALMRAALMRIQHDPGTRLEIRGQDGDLEQAFPAGRSLAQFPTYVLTLPQKNEALRFGGSRNHGSIHRAVNKALKSGVTVREAETEDDLRTWYWLYLDTHRWHARRRAIPARSYVFFRHCMEIMRPKGLARLLLAVHEQNGGTRIIAGSVLFMFGRRMIYAYNGRRRKDLDLRPNDAIHWHAIHDAHRAGFQEYDFGDVGPDNDGLVRFKKKWGADARPQYRYCYPSPAHAAHPTHHTSVPDALRNAIWSRMPLSAWALLSHAVRSYL